MEGSGSKTTRFENDGDSEGRVNKERNANEGGNETDRDPDKELEPQVSLFAPLRKIVHFTLEDATNDPNKILELLEDATSLPTTRNKSSRGSYGIRDDTSAPTSPTQPNWENSGLENKEETKGDESGDLEGDTSEQDTKNQDTSEETIETSEEEPTPPVDTRSATLEKVPSKENIEETKSADQALLDVETPPTEEPKEDDVSSNSGSGSYRSPTSQSPRNENISFATKEKLIKMVKEAKSEKQMLKEQSQRFQSAISAFFKSPKGDELIAHYDKTSITSERVSRTFQEVEAIIVGIKTMQDYYSTTIGEMKARLQEKEAKAQDVQDSFAEFKREIAKAAVNSKTGKSISLKLEEEERKVDQDLEKVRLKNITLRKHLAHLEKELRQKEEVKNGIHLIDFEQLKIENQTFTEKIEERNEEINKLRRKITNTVHILAHVKEKLQFVQVALPSKRGVEIAKGRNVSLKERLKAIEESVIQKRDIVATVKRDRDLLRAENVELKQQSGLIGHDDLLRDFEKRRNESVTVRDKLQSLQATHAHLTEKIANLKTLKSQTMTLSST